MFFSLLSNLWSRINLAVKIAGLLFILIPIWLLFIAPRLDMLPADFNFAVWVYAPILLFVFGCSCLVLNSILWLRNHKSTEYIISYFATVLILFSSISVLGRWLLHTDLPTHFLPTVNTMNPVVAFCFLLLAVAMFCFIFEKWKTCQTFTLLLMSIVISKLLITYNLIDWPIGDIFLLRRISEMSIPSAMSFYTAFSFLFLSTAILLEKINITKKLHISEIIVATVSILSIFDLLSYLDFGINIQSVPLFSSVSPLTAISFLCASVGLLLLILKTHVLKLRHMLVGFGILLVFLILTIAVAIFVALQTQSEAKLEFAFRVDEATKSITNRAEIYINILRGGEGLLSASQSVSRDEWRVYIESLNIQENYPGMQGMGYAVFVPAEQKEVHIEMIRAEGFPDYSIRPEGDRPTYTPVVYLEPFDEKNKQTFGFDMFQEPNRNLAMRQARDTGEPRMSSRVTLVQEFDDNIQTGFLIYVPHYFSGSSIGTIIERQENIQGYVYSPFRVQDFVAGVVGSNGLLNMNLSIYDGASNGIEALLYNDRSDSLGTIQPDQFVETRYINIAEHPWTLHFISAPDYGLTTIDKLVPTAIVMLGIFVSILMAGLFYAVISTREQAIEYANTLTKDLNEAKVKDEAILSSIGDGLVAIDKEGFILLVNTSFERLLGWSKSEVHGKRLVEIVPMFNGEGKVVPEPERLITKALKDKNTTTATSTLKYQRKDSSTFPVSITVSPVILDGTLLGAVEVFRDITQEKIIEQSKDEFVSLASHQLRTPLSIINWYSEALLDDKTSKLSKEQKEYLHEISEGNKRMTALVNSLLNVSRLDLGTFKIESKEIIVKTLLANLKKQYVGQLIDKKITWKQTLDPRVAKIINDPIICNMIFDNLVSNAIKYTPEGGVVTISVNLHLKNQFRFTVSDTGYGIPKAQKSQMFTKMFRAENISSKDTTGTGLGLYMVKSIVNTLGGKIRFESIENKGSTFTIILPIVVSGKAGTSRLS